MIKAIRNFFHYLIDTTQLGFYYICLVFSKGFFFYFYLLSVVFERLFRLPFFKKLKSFFKNKQGDPVAFLFLVFLFFVGVFLHTYLYVDKSEVKYIDDSILEKKDQDEPVQEKKTIESDKETYTSNEINLFRKYGKMDIQSVSFSGLKKVNEDVVAWLMVDGTNVNYPIVKTDNNDYYLNHDIMKNPKASGWTFMDFRNDADLSDQNTIFYGHNLLNKTAFGSLSNVFTDKWFAKSNHYIVVKTEKVQHIYQIFSCYYIDPEIYYLQTNIYRDEEYQEFLNTLKSRSIYDFGLDLTTDDTIITLSTCTDNNKGRKVIHAKLVE